MGKDLLDFSIKKGRGSFLSEYFKNRFYGRMTRNARPLFVRGGDYIARDVQIHGVHEPALTGLIAHFCDLGYGDFLIDIGANIGLTSCQCGSRFQRIHLYEPNPSCRKILEVNAELALDAARYQIHPFGLGDSDKRSALTVPKANWGGGFIRDEANAYDESVLLAKDGFGAYDETNYQRVDIEVRSAAIEMGRLFSELAAAGLKKGVIKIDVEGYEATILKGIAEALPADVQVMIVFESMDERFDMAAVVGRFTGKVEAFRLHERLPWTGNPGRWTKVFLLLFRPNFGVRLEADPGGDWKGDLVLKVH